MCGNCPDFVDMCWEGKCHKPNGGPYGRAAKFFLGDTFCEHLTEKYGTTSASLYDHVYYEHDPSDYVIGDLPDNVFIDECDDDCIAKGWYSREEIERVSRKVFGRDEPEGLQL